jgi:hypothetical protein
MGEGMKNHIVTLSNGSTIDLTMLREPLGMYSKEVREALREHGGPYEIFLTDRWVTTDLPICNFSLAFRLAPVPLTKPAPPWHMLADWVQWVARDSYGSCSGFEMEPNASNVWWTSLGKYRLLDALKIDPGTCDWKDSLVQRPGNICDGDNYYTKEG